MRPWLILLAIEGFLMVGHLSLTTVFKVQNTAIHQQQEFKLGLDTAPTPAEQREIERFFRKPSWRTD
jgi:hypothetical protein